MYVASGLPVVTSTPRTTFGTAVDEVIVVGFAVDGGFTVVDVVRVAWLHDVKLSGTPATDGKDGLGVVGVGTNTTVGRTVNTKFIFVIVIDDDAFGANVFAVMINGGG